MKGVAKLPRKSSMEALDTKVEQAMKQVEKTKAAYEKAQATLDDLQDKQNELRKNELLAAVMNSEKTYESILNYINQGA